jgi:hypothetical protein
MRVVTLALLAAATLLSGCRKAPEEQEPEPPPAAEPAPARGTIAPGTMPVRPAAPPERVTVQHVLIAFRGAERVTATRTAEEAKELAEEILDRARAGEDFRELMIRYSDDTGGGEYTLVNENVTPAQGELNRSDMVKAFGDVAFSISPGNVEMAEYHPEHSFFGWHVIKRIR